jgi:hypothetical protein
MPDEVRKVFPPEGINRMSVQGSVVTSDGTPMTITPELRALEKAHFIRIDADATDRPSEPMPPSPEPVTLPPSPMPAPEPSPAPEPASPLQINTPREALAPQPNVGEIAEKLRASKLGEIQQMDTEDLRQYVESLGHDSHGKRRGSLLSLARSHIVGLPADQLR